MSLAPAERQALARIEDSLRRSDPRLASMLTKFRLPLFRGGWTGLTSRLSRLGPFILVMAALGVVFLLVVAVVFSLSQPSRCVRSGPGFATALSRVGSCPSASGGSQGMARPKPSRGRGYQADQKAPLAHARKV
jgi:hypothetical protein